MKAKLLILAIALYTASASATTPVIYAPGTLSKSCSAVTTTGACTPLQLAGNSLAIGVTWQISFDTGTAGSLSVTLQGSNDNSTWTTQDTSTNTSGESRSLTVTAYKYLRCNVGTYTLGSTNNLTCSLTVNPNGGTALGIHGTIVGGDCTQWFNATTLEDAGAACGSGSSGIASINLDTASAQTFVAGTNTTVQDNGGGSHQTNVTAPGSQYDALCTGAASAFIACNTGVLYYHNGLFTDLINIGTSAGWNGQTNYYPGSAGPAFIPIGGTALRAATTVTQASVERLMAGPSLTPPANWVKNYTSTNGLVTANCSGSNCTGGTVTGTTGQTCTLTSFNGAGSNAQAHLTLTGTNTIASGTALDWEQASSDTPGTGFTSAPTSATLGNGTATCSGTATLTAGVIGPIFTPTQTAIATTATANTLPQSDANGTLLGFAVPYVATSGSFTFLETSGAGAGGATTVLSSPPTGSYYLQVGVGITSAGSGGTCSTGTVTVEIAYKQRDTGGVVSSTGNAIWLSANNNSTATSCSAISNSTVGCVISAPTYLNVGSGTAITLTPYQATGNNCTTPATVTYRYTLTQISN